MKRVKNQEFAKGKKMTVDVEPSGRFNGFRELGKRERKVIFMFIVQYLKLKSLLLTDAGKNGADFNGSIV